MRKNNKQESYCKQIYKQQRNTTTIFFVFKRVKQHSQVFRNFGQKNCVKQFVKDLRVTLMQIESLIKRNCSSTMFFTVKAKNFGIYQVFGDFQQIIYTYTSLCLKLL